MKQSKQNLSNINSYLISRLKLKHQFKYIDIFHFRNLPIYPSRFLSRSHLKILKKTNPQALDTLQSGFTVVLVKETPESDCGIMTVSFCNEEDNFNKTVGLNICLKRLDNYLTKSQDNSWDYNTNNYIMLKDLPKDFNSYTDIISNVLNKQYKPLVNKGYKIFTK